jgi:hypothetical protein
MSKFEGLESHSKSATETAGVVLRPPDGNVERIGVSSHFRKDPEARRTQPVILTLAFTAGSVGDGQGVPPDGGRRTLAPA